MSSSAIYDKVQALRMRLHDRPQRLLIGGQWVDAQSGETFAVIDPATGQTFAQAAAGDAADIGMAVAAARAAFDAGPWPKTTATERTRMLLKLADLIEANAEELALLESLDNGKPFMMALNIDIPMAAECLRYNAGWTTKIAGETLPVSAPGEWHAYTLREPVGVVGQIVAWNFPLGMAVGKIAPALAAGCTVVVKPAEQTPLSAIRLGELILEAGIPEGVVNIVTGLGGTAGRALVEHPDVDKISFTGSTATGKSILATASQTMKRVTLELGGKSPNIIFADADLDRAVEAAAMGVFFNTGQVCVARSRLFVHKDVYDRVVQGVSGFASHLKVGSGLEPDSMLGPVVSEAQLHRITGYVESGTSEGAEVVAGGRRIGDVGYFVEPTVLAGTRPGMKVMREEIFGPVVCAVPFGDEDLDQIARMANESVYGLAASVWTRDLSTAHRLARRIKAGQIEINGMPPMQFALPFGGYKQSGFGRENGWEGVAGYTELKTVNIGL